MGGHVREVRIGSYVCAPGIDYNLCSDPEATRGGARRRLPHDARHGRRDARDLDDHGATSSDSTRAGPAGARARRAGPRSGSRVQRRLFTGLGGTLAPDNAAFLHDPLDGALADRSLAAALRDAAHRRRPSSAACCAPTSCRPAQRSARRCASRRRSTPRARCARSSSGCSTVSDTRCRSSRVR